MKKKIEFFILIFLLIINLIYSRMSTSINWEYLKINFPNGGEQWEVGKTYTIRWSSNTTKKLKLFLKWGTGSGGFFQIASNISNTGRYSYYVKDTKGHKKDELKYFKICIMSMDEKLKDCSNNYFSIIEKGVIHIKHPVLRFSFPKARDILQRGNSYTLSWRTIREGSEKLDIIRIVLLNRKTKQEFVIAENTPNRGFYEFTLPVSARDGTYIIGLMPPDKTFVIASPEFTIGGFDLIGKIRNVLLHHSKGSFVSDYVTFEIWLMNKGTGIFSFVPILISILSQKDNRVLLQNEMGFSNVYPNRYYVSKSLSIPPKYLKYKPLIIEVEIDPKNTLHESEFFRKNNKIRKVILYNMYIHGRKN